MNRKHLLYLPLLLALFIQCNANKEKPRGDAGITKNEPIVIDFKNAKETDEPLKLSEFCDEISYIRLDDSPLINDVNLIPLHLVNDTFYIDEANVYQFGKDGKYIKTLFIIGQGPNEILKHRGNYAAFNPSKRQVGFKNFIPNKFSIYALDGTFIKNESRFTDSITSKDVITYFKNFELYETECPSSASQKSRSNSPIGPHLLYVRNIDTDSIVYTLDNWADDERATYRGYAEFAPNETCYFTDQTRILFKHFALDTIFETSDFNNVYPKFIFDTNGKTVTLRQYAHLKVGDIDMVDIAKLRHISGFIPFADNHLLYNYNIAQPNASMIGFASPDGKTVHHKSTRIINDLDDKLTSINLFDVISYARYQYDAGNIYFLVNAVDFFEEGNKPPFDNFSEESNPVIVKLKLKENFTSK